MEVTKTETQDIPLPTKGVLDEISAELETLRDLSTIEDRFAAHQQCFERLIEEHSVFKGLLYEIKTEYESCIEAIQRGQRELSYLSRKLAQTVGAPPTLRNYAARSKDLQDKIQILKQDNTRIHERIAQLRFLEELEGDEALGAHDKCPTTDEAQLSSWIPGLTLEGQTNTSALKKKLAFLLVKQAKLTEEHARKYVPRTRKIEQLDLLLEREAYKLKLEKETENLKIRIITFRATFASLFQQMSNRRDSTLNKITSLLQEAEHYKEEHTPEEETEEQEEEEDLSDLTEGSISSYYEDDELQIEEMIIEYTTRFNEYLKEGDFEEAAILIAHSPKGCLREPELVEKLKSHGGPEHQRHLMQTLWDSLLPTLVLEKGSLTPWECREYVGFTLDNGQTSQLAHWMTQEVVSYLFASGPK